MKQLLNTKILIICLIITLIILELFSINGFKKTYAEVMLTSVTITTKKVLIKSTENQKNIKTDKDETKITINATGDCTIGYDNNFGYTNSFNNFFDNNGYNYFFENVKNIFKDDDITVINLETTFTDYNVKTPKKFNFKAPKEYVNILKEGSIELVNIANNHTLDYGETGYKDTIDTLDNNSVNYYGYENYYIYSKDDIKIGFGGIYCIENRSCTTFIDQSISNLKNNNVDAIILSFHWGIERNYSQTSIQQYLGHYAIDNGANLVLGHHPHVLEGIELYNNKYIVYSLGNFSFGGNKNPSDKDSMIFNIEYTFKDKQIIDTIMKVIPVSISSVNNLNDYKPTPLEGTEYERVIKKIENHGNINLT